MSVSFTVKLVVSGLLLATIMSTNGCSTMDTHGCFDNEIYHGATSGIYRGTRQDCSFISRPAQDGPDLPVVHEIAICCGICDLPLSLTADTLVFPYDLTTLAKTKAQRVDAKDGLIDF